jgi:DNA-binding MarR family transcriptional regulator
MSSETMGALREEAGRQDQAYQAAVNDFDAAAAIALGVNRTDLRCLEILLTQQETALPSQLGVKLGLTTGSVTVMLDRLERLGYLTRAPDPDDRRKVIVRATPKAVQRVWREIYQPLAEEGLQGIAHYTAADLALVTDFLRRGRQLYERHLARVRGLPPARRHGSTARRP